jgi:hypothetical protein
MIYMSGYKIVLNDYHGRSPYSLYKQHKVKYYKVIRKTTKSIGLRNKYICNNNGKVESWKKSQSTRKTLGVFNEEKLKSFSFFFENKT